ncbi:unnamed protein product [Miscanthus lutarioriparius]|uniref:Uncharacterized protein n=1 Tax=Miscanthus lutarioriparius TaxID=422564 RepID=A0A811S725_9POAL|nr:unnamed protein product [Miscanthus lutarioriparius]
MPRVGMLAEAVAVDGLEIGGDGERRFDKYKILVEVSGEGALAPADGFEVAWSGKMIAFCLPIVSGLVAPMGGGSGYGYSQWDRGSFDCDAKLRALVLAPTSELAAFVKA